MLINKKKLSSYFDVFVYIIICVSPFLQYMNNTIVTVIIPLGIEILYILKMASKKNLSKLKLQICIVIYVFYAVWLVVVTVLNGNNDTTAMNRLVGQVINLFTFITAIDSIDKNKFMTTYLILAKFSLMFFVLQFLLMTCFRIPLQLSSSFPLLDEKYELAFRYLKRCLEVKVIIRYPGVFSEPSHYSIFMMPYLVHSLYSKELFVTSKYRKVLPFIITMTIIISTSVIGIVLSFTVWISILLHHLRKNIKLMIVVPVCLLFISLIFVLLYNQFDVFKVTIDRLISLNATSSNSSESVRVYRGFMLYSKLPVVNKLFGVGYANGNNFAMQHNLYSDGSIADLNIEYFNGIS